MNKFYSFLVSAFICLSANAELTTPQGIVYSVVPDPQVTQVSVRGPIVFTFPEFEKIHGMADPDNPAYEMEIMAHFSGNPYFMLGTISENTITFKVDQPAVIEGNYIFSFDDSFYGVTSAGETVEIEKFNVTWKVSGEEFTPGEYTISIDPEQGVVEKLSEFLISFQGASSVVVKEDYAPKETPTLYIVNGDGTRTRKCYSYSLIASSCTLSFKLSSNVIEAVGQYVLVVPAGLLTIDGELVDEDMEFEYEIKAPETGITYMVDFIPEAGSTVSSLDNIRTIFTSEQEGVTFTRDSYALSFPKLYLLDAAGNLASGISGSLSGGGDDFMWSAYYGTDQDGQYAFVIPAGYIKMQDSNGNTASNIEAIVAYYTLKTSSGIDSAIVDEAGEQWFTLQGVEVKGKPSPGIYILRRGNAINKVVVK